MFKDTGFYSLGQIFGWLKSDDILFSFSPKASQAVPGRFPDVFNHHDKVAPFHRVEFRFLVIKGNLETAGLQTLHVHYKSAIFGMEELHQLAVTTDKYEHIPILHATAHTFMDNTTQGSDTFALSVLPGIRSSALYHSGRT